MQSLAYLPAFDGTIFGCGDLNDGAHAENAMVVSDGFAGSKGLPVQFNADDLTE